MDLLDNINRDTMKKVIYNNMINTYNDEIDKHHRIITILEETRDGLINYMKGELKING